jgi:peptidyl-tRNA hydrolase
MQKLYVVVRNDISPGLMMAQACHAVRLFAEEHPEVDKVWYRDSSNIVCLEVESEEDLLHLADRVAGVTKSISGFREPDLDDEITAVAFGPEAASLLSNLPLALKAA